jgi:hypothetical protein
MLEVAAPSPYLNQACLKERGRVNNRGLPLLFGRMISAGHWDLYAGARERGAWGQGGAPTAKRGRTTLRPGASPRKMIQVVNGDRAPGSTIRGSRLGARRVWSRLGCSGMSSPRLIGMMVFGHDRAGSIT